MPLRGALIQRRLTTDQRVLLEPGIYHGGLLKATAAGTATADAYDGDGTGSPWLDTFRALANEHDAHIFERGLALRHGLFVDLGANVDLFMVYFSRLPVSP